jgi:hypothetical protein
MSRYIFLFVFVYTITSYGQSAWTKNKGKSYLQLTYSTISNYNDIYASPDYKSEREISDNTLQFYGEYGITDKTTLLLNIPLKFITTSDLTTNNIAFTTAESKTSLGNIELGVKHRFYTKKWIIAGQLNVEANTSSFYKDSGIRTGYNAWTFTPTLNTSRSLKKYYIQAFVGVDLRTNNYSSNFKIGGEIGTKITKKTWLIGLIDIVKSLKNGDVILPLSNSLTALYVNNQDYGGFGLKINTEFTKTFGTTVSFGGAFFGNNVAKQVALNAGLFVKL